MHHSHQRALYKIKIKFHSDNEDTFSVVLYCSRREIFTKKVVASPERQSTASISMWWVKIGGGGQGVG